MHLLLVPPEVVAAGEALAALRTLEHLLALVQQLMRPQALRPAEAPAALGAAVGPHARVLPLVPLQVARLAEALAAVGAQVGLLARVGAQVHGELAGVGEALGAVWTRVGLLARVDPLVLLEAVVVGEAFATVGAEVEDLHLLVARVRLELFGAGAAQRAVRTLVLLLLLVLVLVLGRVLQLLGRVVRLAVGQVLHRVVPLNVFEQEALEGEGELAVGAGEELRGAVVAHAAVVPAVLPQVARVAEGFAAALATVGLGGAARVRRMLVPLEGGRREEGGPALGALVAALGRAAVALQLLRVRGSPLAAFAAERVGWLRVRMGGASVSQRPFGRCPRPRGDQFGDGRDVGLGSESLWSALRTRSLGRFCWVLRAK